MTNLRNLRQLYGTHQNYLSLDIFCDHRFIFFPVSLEFSFLKKMDEGALYIFVFQRLRALESV